MTTTNTTEQAGNAKAVAQGKQLLALWASTFAANSPAAMALLYQEGSMLYGSKAELFEGSEGAMRYFSGLASRRSRTVEFTDVTASFAGDAVVAIAATGTFNMSDAPPLVVRWTQTWVKIGATLGEQPKGGQPQGWQVLSHHASPKKPFSV